MEVVVEEQEKGEKKVVVGRGNREGKFRLGGESAGLFFFLWLLWREEVGREGRRKKDDDGCRWFEEAIGLFVGCGYLCVHCGR